MGDDVGRGNRRRSLEERTRDGRNQRIADIGRSARSGEKHPVAPLDVRAHERFDLLPPRRDPVVLLFPDTGLLHDLGIGILAFTLHNQDF